MAATAVLKTTPATLPTSTSLAQSYQKNPDTHIREVKDVFAAAPFSRTQAVPIDELFGKLPEAVIPKDIDHSAVVRKTLASLEEQFSPELFLSDALWRDLYAMVGTFRTFSGISTISKAWGDLAPLFQPHNFEPIRGTTHVVQFGRFGWIQARFSFKTQSERAAECSGQIALVPNTLSGGWKIWFLSTMLERIDGLPDPDRMSAQSYLPVQQAKGLHCDYDCIVVGAGFGGLCLAGRLQAMGVKYLVVEKNDNVGDNWRQRYESARFHTTRSWSEMPHGPVFDSERSGTWLGRDDLAEGYAKYARRHNINVEVSTALKTATRDEQRNTWILKLQKSNGSQYTLHTTHLAFAIGANGVIPHTPDLADRELFQGTVLHSSEYTNARAWSGLRGVVVGTANTAHDVAEDMLDAHMSSVTMVQRGDTLVTPVEWHEEHARSMYNENTGVEYGDRETMIAPLAVSRLTVKTIYGMKIQADPRFTALEKAGFRVDRGGDLLKNLSTTFGGHYVDVGASKKIADGLIKVKGDAKLVGYTKEGLKFSDGSELPADVIVFGTGFKQEFRDRIIEFVGRDVGESIDDYWRNDAEGEYRGAYKPHGVHGIWYTGGGVTFARFYSRFMAIHIRADIDGRPIRQYKR